MRFRGIELLTGMVPVERVLGSTAIDRIISTHGAYSADAELATGGYVRPCFEDGELVLRVGHADPARLIPWEVPSPTPCCGQDHADGLGSRAQR